MTEIVEAARRLTSVDEDTIRDEAQGLCVFCGGGWTPSTGPRGGDRGLVHTNAHKPDCPFDQLRDLLRD